MWGASSSCTASALFLISKAGNQSWDAQNGIKIKQETKAQVYLLINSSRGESFSYHTVAFDMASKYQKIITTVIDNSGITYATILHNYVLHRVITITIG